ncbi:Aconitase/3-isopropylmalate dehydratase protein [Corchorus olitorius]|uniref:Aconitase/3-isopropylmalate dehydratase protein n=1 Tax=Corchorus olitorius TaxID=93759 RepID=A0A1R3GMK3_9ROSI|nr:Aconitase/3-isopropylmalate dehydratase protein [Corchorus olitorius]
MLQTQPPSPPQPQNPQSPCLLPPSKSPLLNPSVPPAPDKLHGQSPLPHMPPLHHPISSETTTTFLGLYYVVRDNIDTDQMIPVEYLTLVPLNPAENSVATGEVRLCEECKTGHVVTIELGESQLINHTTGKE